MWRNASGDLKNVIIDALLKSPLLQASLSLQFTLLTLYHLRQKPIDLSHVIIVNFKTLTCFCNIYEG